MNIFVIGLNHQMIPDEINEQLNFSADKQTAILNRIKNFPGVKECIILITDTRTEVYLFSNDKNLNLSSIMETFCHEISIDVITNKKYFYSFAGLNSVKHLFKITSNLDLPVLDEEDKILDQIKNAYFLAKENKVLDIILNRLFIEAITLAKTLQKSAAMTNNSSTYAALIKRYLIEQDKGNPKDKNVLIIGEEKDNLIILSHLKEKYNKIFLTDKFDNFYPKLKSPSSNFYIIPYCNRYLAIDEADIIISASSDPYYTVTKDLIESQIKIPKKRLLIDIARPNNIDNTIKDLANFEVLDRESLKNTAFKLWKINTVHLLKCEELLDKHVYEFKKWYEFRNFLPMLNNIQLVADEIMAKKTIEKIPDLTNLSNEIQTSIHKGIKNVIYDIINIFIKKIKNLDDTENAKNYFSNLNEFLQESDLK